MAIQMIDETMIDVEKTLMEVVQTDVIVLNEASEHIISSGEIGRAHV